MDAPCDWPPLSGVAEIGFPALNWFKLGAKSADLARDIYCKICCAYCTTISHMARGTLWTVGARKEQL